MSSEKARSVAGGRPARRRSGPRAASDGEQRAPPVVVQDSMCGSRDDRRQVLGLQRAALRARLVHQGVVESEGVSRRRSSTRRWCRAQRGPGSARVVLVVLHHRAAVGAGQLHRVADDRRQHLVEVEARADRLTDLPNASSCSTLRGELAVRWLQGADELDLLDRDAAWTANVVSRSHPGRRRDRPRRATAGAPDDLVVEQHRCADDRPEAAHLLSCGSRVVRDLRGHRGSAASSGRGRPDRAGCRDRGASDGFRSSRYSGKLPDERGELETIPVKKVDLRHVRAAQVTNAPTIVSSSAPGPTDRPSALRTSLMARTCSRLSSRSRSSCRISRSEPASGWTCSASTMPSSVR